MKMKPNDLEPEEGISGVKLLQIVIVAIMIFALFFRYASWLESKNNIPPGGDPPPYSHTAIPEN
jgi:hypothetical protein